LQFYKLLEWEDEGIKDHACELLAKISEVVPETMETNEEEGGEDEEEDWESDSEDEEMEDS